MKVGEIWIPKSKLLNKIEDLWEKGWYTQTYKTADEIQYNMNKSNVKITGFLEIELKEYVTFDICGHEGRYDAAERSEFLSRYSKRYE